MCFHSADEEGCQAPIPSPNEENPTDSTCVIRSDTFLEAALQFCINEARNGTVDIISVGSGSGNIERRIIREYRRHFGKDLRIILVDPNERYEVDFKTVEDHIKQLPHLVGHCVLLIIWPEYSDLFTEDGYDIDAIRTLQPTAVLTLYETTGISDSHNFTR